MKKVIVKFEKVKERIRRNTRKYPIGTHNDVYCHWKIEEVFVAKNLNVEIWCSVIVFNVPRIQGMEITK